MSVCPSANAPFEAYHFPSWTDTVLRPTGTDSTHDSCDCVTNGLWYSYLVFRTMHSVTSNPVIVHQMPPTSSIAWIGRARSIIYSRLLTPLTASYANTMPFTDNIFSRHFYSTTSFGRLRVGHRRNFKHHTEAATTINSCRLSFIWKTMKCLIVAFVCYHWLW